MKPDDLRNIYAAPAASVQKVKEPLELKLTRAHRITRNNSLTAFLLVMGVLVIAIYSVVLKDRHARFERELKRAVSPVPDTGEEVAARALTLKIKKPQLAFSTTGSAASGLSVRGLDVAYFLSSTANPEETAATPKSNADEPESLNRLLLKLARRLIDEEAYDEAEKHLARIVNESDASEEVLALLGMLNERRGNHAVALGIYERLIAANPYQEVYLNNLAVACLRMGNPARAEEALLSAIRINPKYYDARINLALYFMSEARYEDAVEQIRPVVEAQPRNVLARTSLASALLQQGVLPEARRHFEELTLLAPGEVTHYFSVARTFSLDNNMPQSIAWLKLAADRCDDATFQQIVREPEFAVVRQSEEYKRFFQPE